MKKLFLFAIVAMSIMASCTKGYSNNDVGFVTQFTETGQSHDGLLNVTQMEMNITDPFHLLAYNDAPDQNYANAIEAPADFVTDTKIVFCNHKTGWCNCPVDKYGTNHTIYNISLWFKIS